MKVSYSYMSNMLSIISSNNKRLLRPRTTEYLSMVATAEREKTARCIISVLHRTYIYRADVENYANKGTKIYFGLAKTFFKARFGNHIKDFNHEQYKKSTELSKYIWSLTEDQMMSRIRWSIVEKVYGRTKINFCPLCLAEKYFNDNRLFSKRNEFISGYRQVKLLLESFKRK